MSTSMSWPSLVRCRQEPDSSRSSCRVDEVLVELGDVLRGADLGDRHGQELIARIAVVKQRGLVDFDEAQRLHVVDPHRVRMTLEQHAEILLGLPQCCLGVFPTGNVMRKRVEPDTIEVASPPEGQLYRERAAVAMLCDELEAPPEERFVARRREIGQALIVQARVAGRFGKNDILAAPTDGFSAGPPEEHLGLRVPVGDDSGFIDLDVGVIGRFKVVRSRSSECRRESSAAARCPALMPEKADDEQRGQCGQDRQAVLVGQRNEGGGEAKADGGLTGDDGRGDPGCDLRPRIAFGDREVVPRNDDEGQGEGRAPPGEVHQGGGQCDLNGDSHVQTPSRGCRDVGEMRRPRTEVADPDDGDDEPERFLGRHVEALEPPQGDAGGHDNDEDEAGHGQRPFRPNTGGKSGTFRHRDRVHV